MRPAQVVAKDTAAVRPVLVARAGLGTTGSGRSASVREALRSGPGCAWCAATAVLDPSLPSRPGRRGPLGAAGFRRAVSRVTSIQSRTTRRALSRPRDGARKASVPSRPPVVGLGRVCTESLRRSTSAGSRPQAEAPYLSGPTTGARGVSEKSMLLAIVAGSGASLGLDERTEQDGRSVRCGPLSALRCCRFPRSPKDLDRAVARCDGDGVGRRELDPSDVVGLGTAVVDLRLRRGGVGALLDDDVS